MELLKVGDKIRVIDWHETYIGKREQPVATVREVSTDPVGYVTYELDNGYGCDHEWLEQGLVVKLEVKVGEIVKFCLRDFREVSYTGEVIEVITDKDPNVPEELNFDYIVSSVKDGKTYDVHIHRNEILEVL